MLRLVGFFLVLLVVFLLIDYESLVFDAVTVTNKGISAHERHIQEHQQQLREACSSSTGRKMPRQQQPLPPLVFVIMPVYNGSWAVERALRSVIAQTYARLHVLVSVDGGQPVVEVNRTLVAINRLRERAPFPIDVFVQSRNLGFTGNYNFLLDRCAGEFYGFMQHDDWVSANYYAALVGCMLANPQASSCFPPITVMTPGGQRVRPGVPPNGTVVAADSITGTQQQRLITAALETCKTTPHKGLIRRHPRLGFRPYRMHWLPGQWAPDRLQMMSLALQGEILLTSSTNSRTDNTTISYFKYYSADTVHNAQVLHMSRAVWAVATGIRYATYYDVGFAYHNSSREFYQLLHKTLPGRAGSVNVSLAMDEFAARTVRRRNRVAVLGGGIQGTLMALLFQRYGYDVTIFDQADGLLQRTSNMNEGKIHLGFEYNLDKSLRTGTKMLSASLRFSSYLEYLLGQTIDWASAKSTPAMYLVPHSSLVSPDELEAYFDRIQSVYSEMLANASAMASASTANTFVDSLLYLGEKLDFPLYRRLKRVPATLNQTFFRAAFETKERAISQAVVNQLVRDAAEQKVRTVFRARIASVQRLPATDSPGRFRIVTWRSEEKKEEEEEEEEVDEKEEEGESGGGSSGQALFETDVDFVVNCLWDGRVAVDDQMGVPRWSGGNNVRLKMGVHAHFNQQQQQQQQGQQASPSLADSSFPSVTIVNGKYGDFVKFPTQQTFYFTWYTDAVLGLSVDQPISAQWRRYASGRVPATVKERLIGRLENRLNELFVLPGGPTAPGRHLQCPSVVAGLIVATGDERDIDHPDSQLHQRAQTPFYHQDGYFSVSTQKYTTAPYNVFLFEQNFFKSGKMPVYPQQTSQR